MSLLPPDDGQEFISAQLQIKARAIQSYRGAQRVNPYRQTAKDYRNVLARQRTEFVKLLSATLNLPHDLADALVPADWQRHMPITVDGLKMRWQYGRLTEVVQVELPEALTPGKTFWYGFLDLAELGRLLRRQAPDLVDIDPCPTCDHDLKSVYHEDTREFMGKECVVCGYEEDHMARMEEQGTPPVGIKRDA